MEYRNVDEVVDAIARRIVDLAHAPQQMFNAAGTPVWVVARPPGTERSGRVRRMVPPPRRVRRPARRRARVRRAGARRAGGVRSGQDPGEPHPASADQRAVRP